MTNHLARLYSAAGSIVVFFLLWATIAAHPWETTVQVTPQDPRLVALAHREKKLQSRAAAVKGIVGRRWAVYEQQASRRERQNAVALQRHLAQLESSQAAAVRAAQLAVAQTAQARAYAASVVAWANHQLQQAPPGTSPVRAAAPPVAAAKTAAPLRVTAPTSGTAAAAAPAAPSAPAPPKPPSAGAAAPTPPPAAASAPAPAPAAAAPPPAPTPAPAVAPPPVQVVTLPPVTTTKVSKK